MNLKIIDTDMSVCKVKTLENVSFEDEFTFIGKTPDEISLVC